MEELRSFALVEHVASADALEPNDMAVSTEAEMRRILAFILPLLLSFWVTFGWIQMSE